MLENFIKPITDAITGVVARLVPDKSLQVQLTMQLKQQVLSNLQTIMQAQRDVLLAEIQGESKLQRNWRPILMLSITLIVVNNYILFPYINLFGGTAIELELPERLWSLMQIGVGGYIVGRSGEKMVKAWKEEK